MFDIDPAELAKVLADLEFDWQRTPAQTQYGTDYTRRLEHQVCAYEDCLVELQGSLALAQTDVRQWKAFAFVAVALAAISVVGSLLVLGFGPR